MRKIMIAVLAMCSAIGIVVGISAAAEARQAETSWGRVNAGWHDEGTPDYYRGTVNDLALSDGLCVGVERRFNTTQWTTAGFSGTRNVCDSSGGATGSWEVIGQAAVDTQGIRIHSGSRITNLCLGAADCRSMIF